MSQIKAKALEQAIKILDALKLSYLIIDENGNKHGSLEAVEQRKRAPSEFPRGEVRGYILPFIKDMKVGDIAQVNAGKYGVERIRANMTSWMIEKYGKGSCTTSANHETNTVEILRIF